MIAHPDDVDYGAAGTIAHWVRRQHSVTYCVVTRAVPSLASTR